MRSCMLFVSHLHISPEVLLTQNDSHNWRDMFEIPAQEHGIFIDWLTYFYAIVGSKCYLPVAVV